MTAFGSLLCSLSVLTLLCIHGHGIIIDVYRNKKHVLKYEDDNAETEDRAASLPNSPLRGQVYYAMPYRNACDPVEEINETTFNWVALIDNYTECPGSAAWNLFRAGYGMMIAYYPDKRAELFSTPSLPRVIVTSASFVEFLRNNTIIGISPNASEYYIKVQLSTWFIYEKLFMIFGGILLAAVGLSIFVFCCSICCRTVFHRWRTRGLSRWRVRQLPKRKYRKQRETCESCSICLEDFKSGENLRVLPCDHIFHPSCVDEWLQKWNRTCPLCKSTIQRRKRERGGRGGDVRPSASSTTMDREHARLLSHGESEASDEHAVERRESENYGATGHLDNPIATATSDLGSEGGGARGEEEQGLISVDVTVEIPTPLTLSVDDRGENPNLVRNGDIGSLTSNPLEEQA